MDVVSHIGVNCIGLSSNMNMGTTNGNSNGNSNRNNNDGLCPRNYYYRLITQDGLLEMRKFIENIQNLKSVFIEVSKFTLLIPCGSKFRIMTSLFSILESILLETFGLGSMKRRSSIDNGIFKESQQDYKKLSTLCEGVTKLVSYTFETYSKASELITFVHLNSSSFSVFKMEEKKAFDVLNRLETMKTSIAIWKEGKVSDQEMEASIQYYILSQQTPTPNR